MAGSSICFIPPIEYLTQNKDLKKKITVIFSLSLKEKCKEENFLPLS